MIIFPHTYLSLINSKKHYFLGQNQTPTAPATEEPGAVLGIFFPKQCG